jgi:Iap family predicted aminopeptidase
MSETKEILMHHLKELSVNIGPRPAGSAANHAAVKYIAEVLRDAGLDVEEQRYNCTAWEHQETYLEMSGQSLTAAANMFSPSCDVMAPTIAVGTIAELEAADLSGRIGILYGDLMRHPLSPKAWFLISEQERHIIRVLEEKQPVALIAVQSQLGDLDQLIEDDEFHIPSVTVNATTGLTLLKRVGVEAKLRIATQLLPGHSSNVVGRQVGSKPTKLVICAHHDTKINTPGAGDNAVGVAVLLTLARQLSRKLLTHGLELVAFSGEEYLPLGDDEYLRRGEAEFGQIVAAINIDGIGDYLSANTLAIFASSAEFENQTRQLTAAYPGVVWVEPWPESNHSTFAMRGVPSLAFSSSGMTNIKHLRNDDVDHINPAKLVEITELIVDIVENLQGKVMDWTRGIQL